MSELKQLPHAKSTRFFEDRIPGASQIIAKNDRACLPELFRSAGLAKTNDVLKQVAAPLDVALNSDGIHAIELDQSLCLVVAPLPDLEGQDLFLLSVIRGEAHLARRLVSSTIENWSLQAQVKLSKAALQESAAQLAQSFEEQDWLREFARNATTFSKVTAANQAADGILQPLSYLLRAQDLFLIVFPEETHRSGLVSSRYGATHFSTTTISLIIDQLGFDADSQPLVRNQLQLQTVEGPVDSIVAVVIRDSKASRGYLVAINRSVESGQAALSHEFGSGDVALLEEAAALLTTQAQNMHLLLQSNELFLGTLLAMSSAIDARDPYTQGHSERVARLAFELARILGLDDASCQEIYLAGILHDVGKIGIPDSVLLKAGRLTDSEFAMIRKHPEIGHRIVQRLGHLHFALPGILYHHERWDGKGYPHGLKGLSIPLMARIIAVADGFDAMTSCRPYRHAMRPDQAAAIIDKGSNKQWDAEVVACFNAWFSKHHAEDLHASSSGTAIPPGAASEQLMQAVMTLIQ